MSFILFKISKILVLLFNTKDPQKGDALIGYKQTLPGAIPRTVHDKLGEFISVKDFGAKGDGQTDDTNAIQTAINSFNQNGWAVFVPPGKYMVTGTLHIPSHLRLLGANESSCWLIKPPGSSGSLLSVAHQSDVYISDLSIEYGESPQPGSVCLYIAEGSKEILVERCFCKGGYYPILIAGSDQNPVRYVTLRDVEGSYGPIGWGIEVHHAENISFYNCKARWNALDGLKLSQKTFHVLVEGGHYDYNGSNHPKFKYSGDGIDIAQGGDRVTIRGCETVNETVSHNDVTNTTN
mgnify:CR=1 FL=1